MRLGRGRRKDQMGAKGNKSELMDQPATAGESGETATVVKEPKAPKAPKVKAKLGIKILRPIDAGVDKFNNQQKVLIDAMVKLANDRSRSQGMNTNLFVAGFR